MVQERLLESAIREFGLRGIDGASTRAIAASAGTAMSSITYHYGGKKGLYLAAADYIAVELGVAARELSIAGDLGADPSASARSAIKAILLQFIDKIAGDEREAWALFILREQLNPTEAFDRLYAGMMGPMLEGLARCVLAATRTHEDQARLATITLFGQAIVLRMSRAASLRLLRRTVVDDDVVSRFKAQIEANIDAILDRLAMLSIEQSI